ncbi:MAG: ThuA domain-containing protein [Planctomycetaceae bacterium]|nr:ThuA domain-containing protein [Planctomycetaceae bacterium]
MQMRTVLIALTAVLAAAWLCGAAPAAESKRIVFVAGPPSHGYGSHTHYAGCLLLANCLKAAVPSVETVVHQNGWPADPHAFDNADTIVVFADGGGANPVNPHLDQLTALMQKGVGLVFLHYAVQVDDPRARTCFLEWIGGYFEMHWSVNPFWTAQFKEFPDHPVTRGVAPFAIEDEWYYHMRFRPELEGVTPVLSAVPPDATRQGPDGPHSGNPAVRARVGMIEHLAWTRQRPDGGRGFGFTGGHLHWNWAHDQFRKLVLNGIAWTAGIEIPPAGIDSPTPAFEELEQHQDYPQPADFDAHAWRQKIQAWNQPD